VTLDITIALTAQLLRDLLGATVDLVFLAGPVASPGLVTASIGAVALRWLASPDTAGAMALGAQPPLWSLPRQSPLHQVMLETLAGEALPAIRTCSNARLLIDIVRAGQGMALLPETMAREAIGSGALVEVRPRPSRGIEFQAAIRAEESDPVVLDLFRRASALRIDPKAPKVQVS
jgi:DNA-binding transcriptional LysR family regulator